MTTVHDVLRGTSAIASEAAVGLIDLVEEVHATIGRRPAAFGESPRGPTRGVTRLVYQTLCAAGLRPAPGR
jgi:hypothetical protein